MGLIFQNHRDPKMFSIDFLQALNDWQIGGNAKQKNKRGELLKAEAMKLPETYRTRNKDCYRRISLDKKSVWTIGTEHKLNETMSSWTIDIEFAKEFKGGVPKSGEQGIIFCIDKNVGTTILNLSCVYKCTDFISALQEQKINIKNYDKGIGRYGDLQSEIIIETNAIPICATHSLGGYSSPEDTLAKKFFNRIPTDDEMKWSRELMQQAGHKCGPYWLSTPDAVKRANARLVEIGKELQKKLTSDYS